MKMIFVSPVVEVSGKKYIHSWKMRVKETNPYFEWYKRSPHWHVRKEVEV